MAPIREGHRWHRSRQVNRCRSSLRLFPALSPMASIPWTKYPLLHPKQPPKSPQHEAVALRHHLPLAPRFRLRLRVPISWS